MEVVPRSQYACEQSYIPGLTNTPAAPAITLIEGVCTESPYDFDSFFPATTNATSLADMPCELVLFPNASCSGLGIGIYLANMVNDECSFKSGRSALLQCNDTTSADTTALQGMHLRDPRR